jgi:uncharacterized protein (TIGR03435 family)
MIAFVLAVPLGLQDAVAAAARRTSPPSEQQPKKFSSQLGKFEIASIRPSRPKGEFSATGRCEADGYYATNFPLKYVIEAAYGLEDYQISGGPPWLGSQMFDIQAKVAEDEIPTFKKAGPNACQKPLQTLLSERFGLRIRHYTKILPVFHLSIANHGSKLTRINTAEPEQVFVGIEQMSAKVITMPMLIGILSRQVGFPVIDNTGLTGTYTFQLHWSSDVPPNAGLAATPVGEQEGEAGTSLIQALRQQLGLELKQVRGPVESIAIEEVRRPSDN